MEDTITKKVIVDYCSNHTNHEVQLCHLPIQQSIKNEIASKLQEGVAIECILDDVQENIDNQVNREQLLTKQDIHNIKRQFNISSIEKNKNDLVSVCAWVEEVKSLAYNPIILFKSQGVEPSPQVDNVAKDPDRVYA